MNLIEIDSWIGRTLFVPPIIKLCRVTRQSQFAVCRLFWFIAAMDGFYRSTSLLSSLVWGTLSFIMMLTASLRAEMPTGNALWVRGLAFLGLAVDLVTGVKTGKWAGIEFWIFVLTAEYAATIRTIPPHNPKQAVKAREVCR